MVRQLASEKSRPQSPNALATIPISLKSKNKPSAAAISEIGKVRSIINFRGNFQLIRNIIGEAMSGKKTIIATVLAKSSMGLSLSFLNNFAIQSRYGHRQLD